MNLTCREIRNNEMKRTTSVFSAFLPSLLLILAMGFVSRVSANSESDALNAFKLSLVDPNNVLQSWDPILMNPCTWFHVTCDEKESVIRIDLGNANLSGKLVPQLDQLTSLRYLELYSNNISGAIPERFGNLKNLENLDLYSNSFSGPIPDSLGKLTKLSTLRLNNNSLSGTIPMSLTTVPLQILDLSNNHLTGDIPVNGSFSLFTPISFANNPLNIPPSVPSPPVTEAPQTSSGGGANGVIAGTLVAAAALLVVVPAIAITLWRRRKLQDHSLMYLLKKIQKLFWGSSKDILYASCKLPLIIFATITFWAKVDLARFVKVVWLMVLLWL